MGGAVSTAARCVRWPWRSSWRPGRGARRGGEPVGSWAVMRHGSMLHGGAHGPQADEGAEILNACACLISFDDQNR